MILTKSNFLIFKTCPKRLWLHKNRPDLEEIDSSEEKHIQEGKQVGDLAKTYFDNLIDVTTLKDDHTLDLENMIGLTNRYIIEGNKTLAEATFSTDGLFCSVDILLSVENGYKIIEVKATDELKSEHQMDVAFQKHTLEKQGLKIQGVYVMHLNKNYKRHGKLNLNQLFEIENVEDKRTYKTTLKQIEEDLIKAKHILSSREEPKNEYSSKCKKCPFNKHCFKDLPTPNITNIWDFKSSYKLLNQGIVTYKDAIKNNISFNKRQKIQIEAYLNDKETIVDFLGIKSFLQTIKYPIYHLDFESIMLPVPPCDNAWPYEQIPTQYSLHIEYEDGRLEHKEFLGDSIDPRRGIAEALCKDIQEGGCVLVYNKGFEGPRLEELASLYPDLSPLLISIKDKIIDLLDPFRDGFYYHRSMAGSNSIKAVLPALYPDDPELDYHALPVVHNGGEAMDIYPKMLVASPEEKERIRDGLLKYCCLDTLAMVKVLRKLKESIS